MQKEAWRLGKFECHIFCIYRISKLVFISKIVPGCRDENAI